MRKIIFPSLAEIILVVIIMSIFIFGLFNPLYREIAKTGILTTIYCWAILVLFGLLTPCVKHVFNLSFDFNPEENRLGYPIVVDLQSKGGFICNNPIIAKAKVINVSTPQERGEFYNTTQLFKENFDAFKIIWSSAKPAKRKKVVSLEEVSDIGGVELNIKKCSGKSSIIFTSPGKQSCRFVYKTKTGVPVTTPYPKEEDLPNAFLYISPPETLYQIRIFNIIYALLLVILSFWLRTILNGAW